MFDRKFITHIFAAQLFIANVVFAQNSGKKRVKNVAGAPKNTTRIHGIVPAFSTPVAHYSDAMHKKFAQIWSIFS